MSEAVMKELTLFHHIVIILKYSCLSFVYLKGFEAEKIVERFVDRRDE